VPKIAELLAGLYVKPLHASLVVNRRVEILKNHLLSFIPKDMPLTGLDVGCGPGTIASEMQKERKNLQFIGVDILSRPTSAIKTVIYDGKTIPFPDKSFEFIMLIDVLHHTEDAEAILLECLRVSSDFILIKDHICNSAVDKYLLRFMDWIGNRAHGVNLPYNYLSIQQWQALYQRLNLKPVEYLEQLNLYPVPFSWIFDQHLHFISKLVPTDR